MNNIRRTLLSILLTTLLLSSCAGQAPASATPDVNAIMTESVGTFAAQFFQTQTAMVTPATPTPLNTPTFISTNTALALPSPLPSATYVFYTAIVVPTITATGTQYTPTVNPSTLGVGCSNLGFLRDESVPSGTVMAPGETFTKSWKVVNNGTCDWTFGYRLIFSSGERMNGDSSRPNNKIPPGKWTTLSIVLDAPTNPGTYTGYWRLSDTAGKAFGATLAVSIVVKKPADTAVPPTTYP